MLSCWLCGEVHQSDQRYILYETYIFFPEGYYGIGEWITILSPTFYYLHTEAVILTY